MLCVMFLAMSARCVLFELHSLLISALRWCKSLFLSGYLSSLLLILHSYLALLPVFFSLVILRYLPFRDFPYVHLELFQDILCIYPKAQ